MGDEIQEENEASAESLNINNGPRDEQQEGHRGAEIGATAAQGGGGNPATSLNRDSNLGRGIDSS